MAEATVMGGHAYGRLPPGTQLNNVYEIDAFLASGGMGEVYRGHVIETGDTVAIKVIRADQAENVAALGLFRKEASALHHLHHEAIVRYYGIAIDGTLKRPYLAMEFVDGAALTDVIRQGPLSAEKTLLLLRRLAAGLQAAHSLGVIHRDISPDNVILPKGKVRRAKIIDFGIAKSTQFGGGTIIGDSFAGKFSYVSPEQLGLFDEPVTARSDMYSLGLLLAECLRGRPLDMGGTHVQTIEKRRTVPVLDDIDERFIPLLEGLLQPRPADRPLSMAHIYNWELGQPVDELTATEPLNDDADDEDMPQLPRGGAYTHRTSHPTTAQRRGTDQSSRASRLGFGSTRTEGRPATQPTSGWTTGGRHTGGGHAGSKLINGKTTGQNGGTGGGRKFGAVGMIAAAALLLGGGAGAMFFLGGGTSPERSASTPEKTVPILTIDPNGQKSAETEQPINSDRPLRSGTIAPPLPDYELARQEQARQELARQEQVKQEQARQEQVRQEQARREMDEERARQDARLKQQQEADRLQQAARDKLQLALQDQQKPPVENAPRGPRTIGIDERVDRLAKYVRQFDGGPCFYLSPTMLSDSKVEIEGFGTEKRPFEEFSEDFKDVNGFDADLVVRPITASQCAITRFLRLVDTARDPALRVTVQPGNTRPGQPLTASVAGAGARHVEMLLVTDDGSLQIVPTRANSGRVEVSLQAGADGDRRPKVLIALATAQRLQATTFRGVAQASVALEAISDELMSNRQPISLVPVYLSGDR